MSTAEWRHVTEEALQRRIDIIGCLLVRVVADAGNADESTARRVMPTAVDGIGEHVRVGVAPQVKQWDVDPAVHQFHESSSLAA